MGDQVHVGLVHLVRLEQGEEDLVSVVGRRPRSDEPDPTADPLDVAIDRHERCPE
jgi:hypothetical protein